MSSNSNGPFKGGPPFRVVYDKHDIIVQAMLNAGLEEYITNGFYLEEIDYEEEQKKEDIVKNDDLEPESTHKFEKDLSEDLQQTPPVEPRAASKTFHSNKSLKYKKKSQRKRYKPKKAIRKNSKAGLASKSSEPLQ